MIFETIYIKSFGKLSQRRFDLKNGVNILEGANESGKSTICAFIQFIFYGLPHKTEEKLRYISWNTASAGGSLSFFEGDRHYRIEREVICSTNANGKYSFRERLGIFDADTGLAVFKGQSPGEVFFGVSSYVFENTAYIRQSANSKIGGDSLGEEAQNILFSGNERVNTKKAIDQLDSARAFLLHKNKKGGKITELEEERAKIEEQLEIAKQASGDLIYLEGSQRQLSQKKEDSERRLESINRELELFNRYTVKKACLRSKAEEARLADVETKIQELQYSYLHNGKDISHEDYIVSLEKKQNDLELAASRYADAEQNVKDSNHKIEQMSEKLAIFERFGSKGGKTREELVEKVNIMQSAIDFGSRIAAATCMVAIAMGILFCVFRFVLDDIPPIISYILLALVPVFLALTFIFLAKNKQIRLKLMEICSKFGCITISEFEELVRAATEDEAYMVFITNTRDESNHRFNQASAKLERVSADIVQTLRDDGFTMKENTAASLSEAIRVCRETQKELAKLTASADEINAGILAIADDLSVYSDDYLKEALFGEYDEAAMESFQLAAKKRDRDFLVGSVASLTKRLHEIELQLASLSAGTYKPTELAEQKALLDEQILTLTKKWSIYLLAIESIENASGKLREGISPKLAKNAGMLMHAITEGKYSELFVDHDFSLSFSEEGFLRDAAVLSAGTGDLAYICLRIALMDLLYKKSMPPFIFDESFVRMDDERLQGMIALLHKYAKKNCQSLLFSCHSRERKISDSIGEYSFLAI